MSPARIHLALVSRQHQRVGDPDLVIEEVFHRSRGPLMLISALTRDDADDLKVNPIVATRAANRGATAEPTPSVSRSAT